MTESSMQHAPDGSTARRVRSVEWPKITVAVPARNEERTLAECLASILSQSEESLQVVVVDGASVDGTRAIADRFAAGDARVEVLVYEGASIPASMNTALRAARGRWFVRVDAHSTVPPDYMVTAVRHLETGRWGGVGGRKDGVGDTKAGRAIAAAMGSRFGVGNSTYHHGMRPMQVDHVPFGAYPTTLARGLGGWNEQLTANEDYEFDFRLRRNGEALLFDPALRISWHCRQSIRDLFRQYRRYGRGKADVARLHPTSLKPRHLAAPAIVGVCAIVAGFWWLWPEVALVLLGGYLATLLLATIVVARRVRGVAAKLFLPLVFASMHLAWGLGFWEGILRGIASRARRRTSLRTVDAMPGGRPIQ
jgi:succinoglycan biosynthesis protein ExoA